MSRSYWGTDRNTKKIAERKYWIEKWNYMGEDTVNQATVYQN